MKKILPFLFILLASLPAFTQSFTVSNAALDPAANGTYTVSGTNDGVDAYSNGTFHMYRAAGLAWVICSDPPPFANCVVIIDLDFTLTSPTPPIGAWGSGTTIAASGPPPGPVPTMSQWGLILTCLLVLSGGVIAVWQRQHKGQQTA